MSADATSSPGAAGQADPAPGSPQNGSLPGVVVAGMTACISGLSVFVNSYGVHAIATPSVYTTAKNLVATVILGAGALVAWSLRRSHSGSAATRFVTAASTQASPEAGSDRWTAWGPARWVGLMYVGIVGGGVAFILFFDGLADTAATPAAFWRDTLVIWVAALALPCLREHVTWWNVAAIAVLVAGEVAIAGGVGHLVVNRGEILVLGSTLLWAVEVVVAKVLLRDVAPGILALVRMGVGALTLVAYLVATGGFHILESLGSSQIGWALLTGLLLAAYVGTWMTALARARALDVTSILVGSALITALLSAAAGTTSLAPKALGLLLVAAGAGAVFWASLVRPSVRSRDAIST